MTTSATLELPVFQNVIHQEGSSSGGSLDPSFGQLGWLSALQAWNHWLPNYQCCHLNVKSHWKTINVNGTIYKKHLQKQRKTDWCSEKKMTVRGMMVRCDVCNSSHIIIYSHIICLNSLADFWSPRSWLHRSLYSHILFYTLIYYHILPYTLIYSNILSNTL